MIKENLIYKDLNEKEKTYTIDIKTNDEKRSNNIRQCKNNTINKLKNILSK